MKHNNVLPNQHFRKDWQLHVKTWFDQPAKKVARRQKRTLKAARVFPRPVDALRPCVRCPTLKYNTKLRLGRGFSLQELQQAGISKTRAKQIAIPIDHRRRNRCSESLNLNADRLTAYAKRVVVGKVQVKVNTPVLNKEKKLERRAVVPEIHAFRTLRLARSDARLVGMRKKRADIRAEEEAQKKK